MMRLIDRGPGKGAEEVNGRSAVIDGREMKMTSSRQRQRSRIHTLDEGLAAFEHVLPSADAGVRDLLLGIRDAVIRTQSELDQIHISSLPLPGGIHPTCFDCGDKHLDVVYTSKRDRCQLCAPCFNRREKRGAARTDSRAPQSSALSSIQPE